MITPVLARPLRRSRSCIVVFEDLPDSFVRSCLNAHSAQRQTLHDGLTSMRGIDLEHLKLAIPYDDQPPRLIIVFGTSFLKDYAIKEVVRTTTRMITPPPAKPQRVTDAAHPPPTYGYARSNAI